MMVAQGWRVTAVAPDIDAGAAEVLTGLGAEPLSIKVVRKSMNPLSELAYWSALVRLFSIQKPDVVFAYTIKPVIWGGLAARVLGVPRMVALITGLGFAFTDGAGAVGRRAIARTAASLLYRLALSRADRVLFQNPDDRELFVRQRLVRDDGRIRVIDGSGVDLSHYGRVPLPDGPSFLAIARLLGAKGVREYAQAALTLKSAYPHVPFRLAGWIDPGPDSISEDELQGWIDGGLEYLGRLSDVRPAIAQARVFVLPSYREGTPRSVLEAMAMGRAVVTSDAPGCRETVVDGHNGFLVPPRETEGLIKAMERFILEPALADRMGEASFARARERYDVHKVNADILAAVRPD